MRRTVPRSFGRDTGGSTTVEFVVVFLGFVAVMFFVVEVTLYMFFMASLEKAAEAGVRAAVVSRPVVGVSPHNVRFSGVILGSKCGPATCAPWPEPSVGCGDAEQGQPVCAGSTFGRILNHMQKFNGQIQNGNVAISYAETGIGFAGGPAVPMVTVTVSGVPYQTGMLGLLLGADGDGDTDDANMLEFLPRRSASMTGEDLAR